MHELYPADLARLSRSDMEKITQQRAQAAYLGKGVALARILTRYKMLLHTSDRGFGNHLMMDGFWEIWLTQFFARKLRPGMRVVDVGANYGYHTMLFADIVTSSGHVIAVEPNPDAADLLRQSILLNGFAGHTTVIEAALGATSDGTVDLAVPAGEPKNANTGGHAGPGGITHTVALTNIDRLNAQFGPIDLVKIDAEGAEVDIITGMSTVLHASPPALVLEFNTGRCADPLGFLSHLIGIYGSVMSIGFDAEPVPIGTETLLTVHPGEDWMLYFARPAA